MMGTQQLVRMASFSYGRIFDPGISCIGSNRRLQLARNQR